MEKTQKNTLSTQGSHLAKARQKKLVKSEQGKNQVVPKKPTNSGFEPVELKDRDEFFIIHASYITSLVEKIMCSECEHYGMRAVTTDHQGFSAKLKLICENCENVFDESFTSPRLNDSSSTTSPFKVNRKLTEGINNIGCGYAALERLCADSSIKPPSSKTYRKHLKAINTELADLEKKVLVESRQAVRRAYETQDPSLKGQESIDGVGTYDGTWPKRGHTSSFGVGILFDLLTGLVTDYEILSKYCHMCTITAAELDPESPEFDIWHQGHAGSGECNINFSGSSGSMEVQAAQVIWKRSLTYGMRYTTILSDGDSNTWKQLVEDAPYGPKVKIVKEECINHVHKRLGTRLRDAAKKFHLGGKKDGALTGEKIKLLQRYYRKAIAVNSEDLSAMKDAVKATLLHCCSTNEKPDHSLCPQGVSSWCFYNKTLALNDPSQKPKSHTKMTLRLNSSVFEKIEPIYDELGSSEFLTRCARGETQNRNESLHALIWRKCPKEVFVSRQRIQAAVINAIIERNYGIIHSANTKAVLRNEKLSHVSRQVYERMEQRKGKRKVDQDASRYSKRLKKCQEERKKVQTKANKQRKSKNSKDYGAGCH